MTLLRRICTVLSIRQYGTDIRIGAILELRHSLIRRVSASTVVIRRVNADLKL